jgi:hypothetical protein
LLASTYYFDESGNTGGLARPGTLAFDGQPVFVLACIGCVDTEDLGREIQRLKQVHTLTEEAEKKATGSCHEL